MDVILVRAIQMCLTGNVTWRGTAYQKSGLDGQLAATGESGERQPDQRHNS